MHQCLQLVILLVFVMLPITESSYSKVQYLTVYLNITAITNCKIQSNAIYTTSNGQIHHWKSYQKVASLSLNNPSIFHKLDCSRYGTKLDHSYVAVLELGGGLYLLEEKSSSFTNQLNFVPGWKLAREGLVRDVSVGGIYLGVLYVDTADAFIDLYKLPETTYSTFYFNNQVVAFKLDHLGNLAYIDKIGQDLYFHYCVSPLLTKICHATILPEIFSMTSIALDYKTSQVVGQLSIFLISNSQETGQISCSQTSTSAYKRLSGQLLIPQFCDNELTYISPSLQGITKQQSGELFTLSNPITAFTCTTDTGSYIHSQFYMVTKYGGTSYIDCYYDVNQVLNFLIGAGLFCCCFCLRICASCSSRGCECVSVLLYGLYYVLCWCPTRENMDDLEDSLET